MSTLSLRLPESLHQKLGELAEREGISINQLISSAVAEKISALLTEKYLLDRAKRGNRSKFEAVLAKVPAAPPLPGDELPKMVRDAPLDEDLVDSKLRRTAPPRGSRKKGSTPGRRRPRR